MPRRPGRLVTSKSPGKRTASRHSPRPRVHDGGAILLSLVEADRPQAPRSGVQVAGNRPPLSGSFGQDHGDLALDLQC